MRKDVLIATLSVGSVGWDFYKYKDKNQRILYVRFIVGR